MFTQLRPALVLTVLLTVLTGLLYPLAITGVAGVVFPAQAGGSLIERDGTVIGSALIGQNFAQDGYFWPRPSATGPEPYNAAASTGSNYGPTSAALVQRVAETVAGLGGGPVPADAATTSASGLDPHISPAYALLQVGRVAAARGVPTSGVQALVQERTEQPWMLVFGERRVNVLLLNLALDEAFPGGDG